MAMATTQTCLSPISSPSTICLAAPTGSSEGQRTRSTAHPDPISPYRAGNVVRFRDEQNVAIDFQILHLYEPPSLAFVMQVTAIDRPDLSEKMILKVVDSRWLSTAREQNGLPPWDQERQREYIASVLDGSGPRFWERICNDGDFWEQYEERKERAADDFRLRQMVQSRIDSRKERGNEGANSSPSSGKTADVSVCFDEGGGELPRLTIAEEEVLYFVDCGNEFNAELQAYKKLQEIQGRSIPRLYMSVVSEPWADAAPDIQEDYLQCHGLLLEYIDGTCLRDLTKEQPDLAWGDIARAVSCAVNIFPYYHYIHQDLYARNIILRKGASYEPENFVIFDLSRGCFIDPSGKEEAEEKYPFSAWCSYETYLFVDVLHDIPSMRLRSTGPPEELEYGSCRFGHWFEDHSYMSDYEIRREVSEMLIQGGVWRLQKGQSPIKKLKEKFDLSRKARRIVMEEQESCDEPHWMDQEAYDFRNGWEPKAVKRIAEEVMTGGDMYCDPEAAWKSFCEASVDWQSSQDRQIFEQVPKTHTINPSTLGGPLESLQAPELKEPGSLSTSSRDNEPSQLNSNEDDTSPSAPQESTHRSLSKAQSFEGNTMAIVKQPSERRLSSESPSNEGNTVPSSEQSPKQVRFVLPPYQQSSTWFAAIRRLSGRLLSNLRESSLRISDRNSAFAQSQLPRNSADLKTSPVFATNLPLLVANEPPPKHTTSHTSTSQTGDSPRPTNNGLLHPFTTPRKQSTSLAAHASDHPPTTQLGSPTPSASAAEDPSPSVSPRSDTFSSPRSDTFSAPRSSTSTAPTEYSEYAISQNRNLEARQETLNLQDPPKKPDPPKPAGRDPKQQIAKAEEEQDKPHKNEETPRTGSSPPPPSPSIPNSVTPSSPPPSSPPSTFSHLQKSPPPASPPAPTPNPHTSSKPRKRISPGPIRGPLTLLRGLKNRLRSMSGRGRGRGRGRR